VRGDACILRDAIGGVGRGDERARRLECVVRARKLACGSGGCVEFPKDARRVRKPPSHAERARNLRRKDQGVVAACVLQRISKGALARLGIGEVPELVEINCQGEEQNSETRARSGWRQASAVR
jgi:hypothetical protein